LETEQQGGRDAKETLETQGGIRGESSSGDVVMQDFALKRVFNLDLSIQQADREG
jgi:hypothetical protein